MRRRGNVDRLTRDADRVVARLLAGDASIVGVMAEYHVAYPTLTRVYHACTTPAQHKAADRLRRKTVPNSGRFKKRHAAWNKGLKGIRLSPATEFKPGCIRGNAARKYRALGTISIRYDSRPKRPGRPPLARNRKRRRFIKVRENRRPHDNWIPYARWLWLERRGPIPEGIFVVHVDGDSMNDSLDNLRLVDRRGHVALQRARDPGMEQRRMASVRRAMRRHRRHHNTARVAVRRSRADRGRVITQCAACGYDLPPSRDSHDKTCPKCGGSAWETLCIAESA